MTLAQDLKINVEVCETAQKVRMTGPWWSWDPNGGPEAVSNGNGTWTFTFTDVPDADMEYLLVVDDVQENLIQAMVDGGTCAPVTDYSSYANRKWLTSDPLNLDVVYGKCSSCIPSAQVENYFADFSIYPNPASDILIISNSNKLDRVQMINVFGSVVINQEINSTKQIGKGSYHNKKDLPKLLKTWEQNIYQTVLKYKKLYK